MTYAQTVKNQHEAGQPETLKGWKEIAEFLGEPIRVFCFLPFTSNTGRSAIRCCSENRSERSSL